jgi:hypothetical protein
MDVLTDTNHAWTVCCAVRAHVSLCVRACVRPCVRACVCAGKLLTCTQCKHWSMQARNWDLTESSIRPASCTPEEWIGNRDGALACESKPQNVLEEEAKAAGELPPDLDAQLEDDGKGEL